MCIRLSEKHGVNPSLEQCFVCTKDVGVVLFGKLEGDAKAPRTVCLNQEPCDECKGHMSKGVVLISVRDDESEGDQNPYRTGGWVVIREEAVRRMFRPSDLVEQVLKRRMAFIPDQVWDALELPRGEKLQP